LTSNRFFIDQTKLCSSSQVFLSGEEHHHLSRVARISTKQNVWLFDSLGISYLARVEKIEKEKTTLSILKKFEPVQPAVKITLAQALVRSKKIEFILQKATELGISIFLPVITAHSIIRIKEKRDKIKTRWLKIARAALKQSRRTILPLILEPLPLERVLKERKEDLKLFLNENKGKYLKDVLISPPKIPSSLIILVGPEGGWSPQEEKEISAAGYQGISLSHYVLRTETAALASLAMISHFWNL